MAQPYPGEPIAPPAAHRSGCLSLIGNILWLFIAGWGLALGYLVSALIMLVLIITIPFVVPCLRLARYSLWPFGHTLVDDPDGSALSTVGNVLWLIFCGWWLALGHFIAGIVLMVTIIGIPFGIQAFKLGVLALWPFGKRIVPA